MLEITIQPDQTVIDIALTYYGTLEAVGEILMLNPDLRNAPKFTEPLTFIYDNGEEKEDYLIEPGVFMLDMPVDPEMTVIIDGDSVLINQTVLSAMNGPVALFDIDENYGKNN